MVQAVTLDSPAGRLHFLLDMFATRSEGEGSFPRALTAGSAGHAATVILRTAGGFRL